MTIEAIQDFSKAIQADGEMARGLIAAIDQKQGGEAVEAFAAYAQEQGFAVTREDAVALQRATRAEEEGALSDDDLDNVAGGSFFVAVLGLLPGAMVATGTLAGVAIGAMARK